MVGGRFNTLENLHKRLVLGTARQLRTLHLPARLLKVYIETLAVTCSVQMDSITHYSLEAASLKQAPTVGMVGRTYIPSTGEK